MANKLFSRQDSASQIHKTCRKCLASQKTAGFEMCTPERVQHLPNWKNPCGRGCDGKMSNQKHAEI
jgi:hypothetical protein